MSDRIKALQFEIEVDSKTGEARLRKVGQGFDRVEGRAKRAGKGVDSLSHSLRILVGAVAAALIIERLARALTTATMAAARFESQNARLALGLRNTGQWTRDAFEGLQRFRRELVFTSNATEEQVTSALAMAVNMGASVEMAKKLARAATDLSVGLGRDLDSAVRQLAVTLGGTSGELGELVPEVKDLTSEQRKAGGAIDIVLRKYQGMGDYMANTFLGRLNNVNSAWEIFNRRVGDAVIHNPQVRQLLQEIADGLLALSGQLKDGQLTDAISKFTVAMAYLAIVMVRVSATAINTGRVFKLVAQLGAEAVANAGFMAGTEGTEPLGDFRKTLQDMQDAFNGAESLVRQLEVIRARIAGATDTGPAAPAGGGGGTEDGIKTILGFGLDDVLAAREKLDQLAEASLVVSAVFADGRISAEQFGVAQVKISEAVTKLMELGLPEWLIDQVIPGFESATSATVKLTDQQKVLGNVLTFVMQGLTNAAGAMLAYSIAGGKANVSLGHLLTTMSSQAAATALFELAAGIAAMTPWGAAIYGNPAQHFAAAKVFGAAALALGLAARAAGGPGGGGASTTASAGNETSPVGQDTTPPDRPQQITIYIEGQGFIQDTDEFARSIQESMEQQQGRSGR